MVQRCCVPLCGTKVGDRDINGIKVRFHRMPLTQERLSQWQDKITDSHRFRPVLSVNSRVCSKHFHKEDYIIKPLDCSKPSSGFPLFKEAVPTRFKWSVENCDISAPSLSIEHSVSLSCSDSPHSVITGGESHFCKNSIQEERENRESDSQDLNTSNTTFETENTHYYDTEASASSSDNIHNIESVSVITMGKNPSQETQCSLEDEKFKSEVHRKNTIIKQLLTKITDLEEEQKLMEEAIAELRAANQSFDNQIQQLNKKNKQLEELYRKCARQHKSNEVKPPESNPSTAATKKNHFDHDSRGGGEPEPEESQFVKEKRVKTSSESPSDIK